MNNDTTLTKFVNVLFAGLGADEVPVLTRPTDTGTWHNHVATPAQVARIEASPDCWYVGLASVQANQEGRLKRDRNHLVAAYAVLCDDVDTKAERAPVEYSYLLESSAGNYQGVWLIEPYPLTTTEERSYYEACTRAITAAGYSDPGAGGAYRVMRIPGSLHKTGFTAQIVEWHPERRWALPDLMDALGLEPRFKPTYETPLEGTVPDDIQDPVMDWLAACGRLGAVEGDWYEVQCPWAHTHTTDGKTAGYSPLGHGEQPFTRGFHCFHSHAEGIHEFLEWVHDNGGPRCDVSGVREFHHDHLDARIDELSVDERVALIEATVPYATPNDLPQKDMAQSGPKPLQPVTMANVRRVAEVCGLRIRQDMLAHDTVVEFADDKFNRLIEGTYLDARTFLRDRCTMAGMRQTGAVQADIDQLGWGDQFSPVCEWMDVPWDGISRFEDLAATVNADERYHDQWRVYLRRWLIQAVQAFHNWQGKLKASEHVLVLIGPQGTLKSTWCEKLLPVPWVDTGVNLKLGKSVGGDRDAVRAATAAPIVELGELETTFSKTAAGHLKNFLSKRADTYRKAYGSTEVSYPRTTAYLATANREDILGDPTGSRRFWLVKVESANAFHTVDMQQLWAEAKSWWAEGEQGHLTPQEEQRRNLLASEFTFETPASELVNEYLDTHDGGEVPMNTTTFLRDQLGLLANNFNKVAVKDALEARLGKPKDRVGSVRRCWMIPTLPGTPTHLALVEDE